MLYPGLTNPATVTMKWRASTNIFISPSTMSVCLPDSLIHSQSCRFACDHFHRFNIQINYFYAVARFLSSRALRSSPPLVDVLTNSDWTDVLLYNNINPLFISSYLYAAHISLFDSALFNVFNVYTEPIPPSPIAAFIKLKLFLCTYLCVCVCM